MATPLSKEDRKRIFIFALFVLGIVLFMIFFVQASPNQASSSGASQDEYNVPAEDMDLDKSLGNDTQDKQKKDSVDLPKAQPCADLAEMPEPTLSYDKDSDPMPEAVPKPDSSAPEPVPLPHVISPDKCPAEGWGKDMPTITEPGNLPDFECTDTGSAMVSPHDYDAETLAVMDKICELDLEPGDKFTCDTDAVYYHKAPAGQDIFCARVNDAAVDAMS